MRALLLSLFFAGIGLVIINQLIVTKMQPPPVQYKYLPRDLDTYLREDPGALSTFSSMFKSDSSEQIIGAAFPPLAP
jgi:hypothetical protein